MSKRKVKVAFAVVGVAVAVLIVVQRVRDLYDVTRTVIPDEADD